MTESAPVTARRDGKEGSAGGHLRFRPDIEGLRALAIVFVVLFHTDWKWAAGGFLGVDVFFVLSGFLITGILLDEIAATGKVSLTNFWARRARRLLPAATLITVVVLAFDAVRLMPYDRLEHAESARAFAVYASNIVFALRKTEYFAGAATRDPMLHTWSLSVEEQFYLLFAPLLLAMAVWLVKGGRSVFLRRFGIAAIVVSLVSLIACLVVVRHYPLISFYLLPPRAWEFGLGALTVLGVRRIDRLGTPLVEAIAIVALIGLLASAVFLRDGLVLPLGANTLIPTVSAAALILSGASLQPTIVARLLSTSPMRLIGRLSYSWYLWHWPMLVYLREYRVRPSLQLSLAVGLLSLLPAAITYKLIESPIRFSRTLQRRAKLTLVGAVLLAVTTTGLATLAIHRANAILAQPRYAPIVAGRVLPSGYSNGCHLTLAEVNGPPCVFGPGTNDTTIVLFGDSHAEQWVPALASVAARRGWKLIDQTKSACPSVTVGVDNDRLGRRYTECDEWRQKTIDRIIATRPTVVIIANTRSYDVFIGDQQGNTETNEAARREWHDGVLRTLSALGRSGARLVVLQDNPHQSYDVTRCLSKNIDDTDRCSTPVDLADTVLASSERSAVKEVPGAAYVNLNELICENGECPVLRDGIVRFQDGNHVSVPFATSLAPEWSRMLTELFAEPPKE